MFTALAVSTLARPSAYQYYCNTGCQRTSQDRLQIKNQGLPQSHLDDMNNVHFIFFFSISLAFFVDAAQMQQDLVYCSLHMAVSPMEHSSSLENAVVELDIVCLLYEQIVGDMPAM